MKKGNRVFSLICLGISLWLVLESSRYNYIVKYTPGPGFFPFWLGVILSIFSIALLMETFTKKDSGNLKEPSRLPGKQALYRIGEITLFIAGFSLLMTSLGFVLSVMLFVSGLLFFMERIPLGRSVITGLIMSACVYLIFEYWMEIGLPPGILGF
jgi:putative tricarboxylic transport membrane protein